MEDATKMVPGDFYEDLPEATLRHSSLSDWLGEGAFALAVLALLNTKNIVQVGSVDRSKINRARIRRGKEPFFTYKMLQISNKVLTREFSHDAEDGDRKLRAHFVRGHFKVRKSGVFFWSSFVRGDLKNGFADKGYQVAA
jgi:hypothetical protein